MCYSFHPTRLYRYTKEITISNCFFDSVGGNGVLLNNFAKNNTITGNHIAFPG
jgi:hypothetical protein